MSPLAYEQTKLQATTGRWRSKFPHSNEKVCVPTYVQHTFSIFPWGSKCKAHQYRKIGIRIPATTTVHLQLIVFCR